MLVLLMSCSVCSADGQSRHRQAADGGDLLRLGDAAQRMAGGEGGHPLLGQEDSNGVSTAPGHTAFTRIPSRAWSSAMARAKPISPCLEA